MRLCAEALFALNAAIDTGLLACSARLCGQKLFWRRLIAAGCLGGVYAVAAVLPELGFLRSGLVKLCAAVGMCLLSFGAGRYLARLTAAFCAMGCVFAGAVTAFTQLTGTGLMRVPGDGYYPVSALALCAIGALCVAVCRLFFSACAQHSARLSSLRFGWKSGRSRCARWSTPETRSKTPSRTSLFLCWTGRRRQGCCPVWRSRNRTLRVRRSCCKGSRAKSRRFVCA